MRSDAPQQLHTPGDVAEFTDDSLVRWTAQALLPDYPNGKGRAWRWGDAVVATAPVLNRADRFCFTGSVADAAALVAWVLETETDFPPHPLARTELAEPVVEKLGLHVGATFGWMELVDPPASLNHADVQWLPENTHGTVEAFLREFHPHSYVMPNEPGSHRWAGIHDESGELVAVGADAWAAPDVGFIGGVATRPDRRGQGLSQKVCGFVAEDLRQRHADVALMVDKDNTPAIRVYERLGFRYRSVSVSRR